MECVGERRTTWRIDPGTKQWHKEDEWQRSAKVQDSWSKGVTEFEIKQSDKAEAYVAEKKKQNEVIREDLRSVQGEVRWIEHSVMLADGLTKVRGCKESLYRVLETGTFSIRPAEHQTKLREEALKSDRNHVLSKFSEVVLWLSSM